MAQLIIENETFTRINFKETPLEKGEYENCEFIGCDFSNTNLSAIKFIICRFADCNLSLVKLVGTALQEVSFKGCKMLGLRFEDCNEFGFCFGFENCTLNHSSFYRTKIKGTLFKNSHLQETDFTECNLTASVFDNCDLSRAVFENSVLEKCDFRTAYNYSIDAEKNKIKKARFSLPEVIGLLHKYDIQIEDVG